MNVYFFSNIFAKKTNILMFTRIFVLIFVIFGLNNAFAQKYFTKTAQTVLIARTQAGPILAHNQQGFCVIDLKNGTVTMQVLMKSYGFKHAFIQEAFNDTYLESSKYPKAVFKGNIKQYKNIKLNKNAVYTVDIEGIMTAHGQSQNLLTKAQIEVKNNQLICKSRFKLKPQSYNIKLPTFIAQAIGESIEIKLEAVCKSE
jgi:hypothetical protein